MTTRTRKQAGNKYGFSQPLEEAATSEADEDLRAYRCDWIDIDLSTLELPDEYKELYDAMVRERHRAFAPDPEFPGKTNLVKLKIDTGDHKPIAIPPRRQPYAHDEFVSTKLDSYHK